MKYFVFVIIFLVSCSQPPEYYLKRGNSFFISGDYYNAIDMYSQAIYSKPDYSDAYVMRAMVYEKIGNKTKAIDDYLNAIKYNDKNLAAYNNLASIYIESSLYKDALDLVNKAISIDPSYKYAYYNRGVINYHLREYSLAIDDFTKAIELSSNTMPLAWFYRGMSYYNLGVIDKAVSDLREVVDKTEFSSIAYINLARMMIDYNPKLAYEYIDKVKGFDDNDAYYYLRAKINEKLNDLTSAISDINNAIRLSNFRNADYLYYGADLYIKMKDFKTAKKYCDMAINLKPDKRTEYEKRIRLIRKFAGKEVWDYEF